MLRYDRTTLLGQLKNWPITLSKRGRRSVTLNFNWPLNLSTFLFWGLALQHVSKNYDPDLDPHLHEITAQLYGPKINF